MSHVHCHTLEHGITAKLFKGLNIHRVRRILNSQYELSDLYILIFTKTVVMVNVLLAIG